MHVATGLALPCVLVVTEIFHRTGAGVVTGNVSNGELACKNY